MWLHRPWKQSNSGLSTRGDKASPHGVTRHKKSGQRRSVKCPLLFTDIVQDKTRNILFIFSFHFSQIAWAGYYMAILLLWSVGRWKSSLSPRLTTNPSTDRFQYHVILEVIYAPDEVWGRDQWKSYQLYSHMQRAVIMCYCRSSLLLPHTAM